MHSYIPANRRTDIPSQVVLGIFVVLLPWVRRSIWTYPAYDWLVLGLIVLTGLLLLLPAGRQKRSKLTVLDLAVMAFGCWIGLTTLIRQCDQITPTTVSWGLFYFLSYRLARRCFAAPLLYKSLAVSAVLQGLLAIMQYAGIMAPNKLFFVTGTFANPAPLACLLALGTVSVICWIFVRPQWVLYPVAAILVIALFLTASRAGWVAAVVAALYLTGQHYGLWRRLPRYGTAIGGAVLLLALVGGLYLLRTDSANGRVLIWKVSARMVADHPVPGHGLGSFPQSYPFYQAEYFAGNPQSPFIPLADNVQTPFNEFLSILVQTGIIGLILFGVILVIAWRSNGSSLYKAVLLCLLIFGCFSYPFSQPVFVLIFLLALAGLAPSRTMILLPRPVSWIGSALVVCYVVIGGYSLLERKAYTYRNDPAYLSRETQRLYDQQQYDSAALLFPRIPSIEQCTDLAKGYTISGEYEKARAYAVLAGNMAPNRIMPWYLLFRTYELQQMPDSAMYYANITADFNPKVENTTTLRAKREARRYVNRFRTE